MERITRKDCEGLLRRLTAQTDLEMSPVHWPVPEGALLIQDESGVKRVVTGSGNGVADNGWPGFSTYRELWGFLRGMVALAEMRA